MYGIFTYIYNRFMINVGQYSSPMEHMGLKEPIGSRKPPKKPILVFLISKGFKVEFHGVGSGWRWFRRNLGHCQQILHHLPIVVFPWSCYFSGCRFPQPIVHHLSANFAEALPVKTHRSWLAHWTHVRVAWRRRKLVVNRVKQLHL